MPVDSQRSEYVESRELWDKIDDVVAGQHAVKAKRETYLNVPSGYDLDTNIGRRAFSNYLLRARLPDVAALSRGFVGTIQRKDDVIELPTRIEYLRERATPDGLSLAALAKRHARKIIEHGRSILLVDDPRDGALTTAQPMIVSFDAKQLINWREEIRDGKRILTLAVLETSDETQSEGDEFVCETSKRWQVLRLDEIGYSIEVWGQEGEQKEPMIIRDRHYPTMRGKPFSEIPIRIAGATDMIPDIDEMPMLPIVESALAIYQLSADLRQGLHIVASPTLYVAGHMPDTDEDGKKKPIRLGPTSAIFVSEQGKVGFAEIDGSGLNLIRQDIDREFDQMIALGASLMEPSKKGVEAAESMRIRHAAKSATLQDIATVKGDSIRDCLRWCAAWADADPDQVVYEPNTDFVEVGLSAQERSAIVESWIQGAIGRRALYETLREGEALPEGMEFEDYLADVEGVING